MSQQDEQAVIDEKKERIMRFARFFGFLFVIVVLWYASGINEGL